MALEKEERKGNEGGESGAVGLFGVILRSERATDLRFSLCLSPFTSKFLGLRGTCQDQQLIKPHDLRIKVRGNKGIVMYDGYARTICQGQNL